MACLNDMGYDVISLETLAEVMTNGSPPLQKCVVITFDDGYSNVYDNAFPILKRYHYPASVFIVGDLVGRESLWAREESMKVQPLMGWGEINEMQRYGLTIGSHTLSHHRLTRLPHNVAAQEITGSKKYLEDTLGCEVAFFAYPYGDYNAQIRRLVSDAGYRGALTARPGFNINTIDPFELRRIDIFGTDSLADFKRKIRFGANIMKQNDVIRYYLHRLAGRMSFHQKP
jgi:peptidoglycan/xylan/chitin deacetylase (PgdA/CDA1 family)